MSDYEREKFERWFSDGGKNMRAIERDITGGYMLIAAHTAWRAWQARAALAQPDSDCVMVPRGLIKQSRDLCEMVLKHPELVDMSQVEKLRALLGAEGER